MTREAPDVLRRYDVRVNFELIVASTSARRRRQRGRTPKALLEYVIDFHRLVGGAKFVRKGPRDCPLIKTEEKPPLFSLPILIKDVPINQLFKIGKGLRKTFL